MLQSHIHIAPILGPAPEYAPVYLWKTINRVEIPTVFMTLKRTLNGRLRPHVLSDTQAQPRRFTNLLYTLKIGDSTLSTQDVRNALDALSGMLGQRVYVVDHYHGDAGTDHRPYTRPYLLAQIGEITPVASGLPFYLVDVTLEDWSR